MVSTTAVIRAKPVQEAALPDGDRQSPAAPDQARHRLHPKKLLLSKWTAVAPLNRDKHFLVVSVVLPEPPETAVQWVEIEAVRSLRRQRLGWRELQDPLQWRQGWV